MGLWRYGMRDWRGPRLKDVLAKAGVKPGAMEVWLDGSDSQLLANTPDFRKSLPMDKAMADDVIIATSMNGKPAAASERLSRAYHRAWLDSHRSGLCLRPSPRSLMELAGRGLINLRALEVRWE